MLTWLGRGSVPSLVAGGFMMFTSLFLQRFAVAAAFRRHGQPGLALALLLLKLMLVLVLIYVGFNTALIGPLSFAAGATTLPVAIVFDVCYLEWSTRRSRALSN
jgi:hypothetical protein